MDDAKQQLVERLQSANNILVSVSRNPSVDQLAAMLGLALFLNKQGKHAAAVFSGDIPSTIEFLQPEETFEKNTDSLRDFIIALDKNKADKLRYKVEDGLVRIFITPYKTSITEADFDFSQGDFNVDVVLAIGVQQQEDLDEAITAHGRILHDATVATINTSQDAGLGVINWRDPAASSLSELVAALAQAISAEQIDEQIATALLTGIVAETDRFSNDKTSAATMTISAALMAAGANQQLVASKLAEPEQPPEQHDDSQLDLSQDEAENSDAEPAHDGAIEIAHEDGASDNQEDAAESVELPEPQPDEAEDTLHRIDGAKLITEAPTLGGTLTANSTTEQLPPPTNMLADDSTDATLLSHNKAPEVTPLTDTAVAGDDSQVVAPLEPVAPEAFAPPAEASVSVESPQPVEQASSAAEPQAEMPAAPEPTPAPAPQPSQLITGLTPPPPNWVPPQDDPLNLASNAAMQPASDLSLAGLEQSIAVPVEQPAPVATLDTARDAVSDALNATSAPAPSPAPIQALGAQPLAENIAQTPEAAPVTPEVSDPTAPPPVPPPIPFNFGGGTPPAAS